MSDSWDEGQVAELRARIAELERLLDFANRDLTVVELRVRAEKLEGDVLRAVAVVRQLRVALESLRRHGHEEIEDCWYSCSQSDDCCDDSRRGQPCDCGADGVNATIDAALVATVEWAA